jgi:adenosylmethionine-8-amino-7-oxononanoate aminotransferase
MIEQAFDKIAPLDNVGDVRNCGLMGAIEIVKDKDTKEPFLYEKNLGAKLCMAIRSKGAMIRPLGDVVAVMPPVAIDPPTLKQLLDIITETIENDLPQIVKDI